jgi:hypothetical protein
MLQSEIWQLTKLSYYSPDVMLSSWWLGTMQRQVCRSDPPEECSHWTSTVVNLHKEEYLKYAIKYPKDRQQVPYCRGQQSKTTKMNGCGEEEGLNRTKGNVHER